MGGFLFFRFRLQFLFVRAVFFHKCIARMMLRCQTSAANDGCSNLWSSYVFARIVLKDEE